MPRTPSSCFAAPFWLHILDHFCDKLPVVSWCSLRPTWWAWSHHSPSPGESLILPFSHPRQWCHKQFSFSCSSCSPFPVICYFVNTLRHFLHFHSLTFSMFWSSSLLRLAIDILLPCSLLLLQLLLLKYSFASPIFSHNQGFAQPSPCICLCFLILHSCLTLPHSPI